MISVLIPVFNYDISPLVMELKSQLEDLKFEYEIIFAEDGSKDFLKKNRALTNFETISCYCFQQNLGRSKVRNLLSKKAKYNWLLFLDADVIPVKNNFIKNYIIAITATKGNVFFGGIKNPIDTGDSEKLLRWKYGQERENIDVETRKKNPNKYFLSSNFLIHKTVFKKILFDERIEKYGFEDFLFNQQLKTVGEEVIQLENLVFHYGIETNTVFLNKTKEAIENLHFLNEQNFSHLETIKLLNYFKKTDALKLTKLFSKLFVFFERAFESNLKGKYPSLVVFDTYKLFYFCYLHQEN